MNLYFALRYKVPGMELLMVTWVIFLLWHPVKTLADENDNNIEADLSSLIFVFDTTGSMGSELNQVIAGALQILQKLSQNEQKIIHDYIFVPFNDPKVGPAIQTTNATYFDEMLRKVTVDGGDDCPEMSLTGIKQGLEMGLPNSFLFVFTDADPKDSELLPKVLTAISAKHSKVVFILTDSCSSGLSEEYQKIATISNGQIFDLGKSDITEVLKFIQFNVKSRRVDLLAVDDHQSSNKKDQKFDVSVDDTMKELVLSLVTKENAVLKVINPSGQTFSDSSFCHTFLEIKTTRMCSVQNPEVGIWMLLLEAISSFTLRVSAASDITFDFGFEVYQDNQTVAVSKKALCKPVGGTENTFFIKLNDTSQIASLTAGEVISLEGQIMKSFSLKPVPHKDDLYYGSFTPTNNIYHLRINGETKSGSKFQRITSVAFSSLSNDTRESVNCTAQKIDHIPETDIKNSSSRLTSFKQSWITCWLIAIALVGFD